MVERGDPRLVEDMREAVERIQRYTDGLGYGDFLNDTKTQDAVVRNLEILGEAVKRLSSEFRAAHGEVDWTSIAGMRDRLVHHYFGVNWEIVWDVVRSKLPELLDRLHELERGD